MYVVFRSFSLVTWIYLELSHIVGEDGEKDPRDDGKAEQVPGPALYIKWGCCRELGSAKVQGTSSG